MPGMLRITSEFQTESNHLCNHLYIFTFTLLIKFLISFRTAQKTLASLYNLSHSWTCLPAKSPYVYRKDAKDTDPTQNRLGYTWRPRIHPAKLRESCVSETRYFPCCSPSTHQSQHPPEWSPGCCCQYSWPSYSSLPESHAEDIQLVWDLENIEV